MAARDLKAVLEELIRSGEGFTASLAAERAGVTRQAVNLHIQRLLAEGSLERSGAGRAVRYRGRVKAFSSTYALPGLQEDQVWRELTERIAFLRGLPPNVEGILAFSFTELLNNAIDHSGGTEIRIRVSEDRGDLHFDLHDDGVGVFRHLRQHLGLSSELEAIQEVSKGKVTTDPQRHTGQGIFFSSKAVDVFELESGALRWTVDTLRKDVAVMDVAPPVVGTRVHFQLAGESKRELAAVFNAYTDEDLAFSRTRTYVKLFELGLLFASRSEAKRLLFGVEKFAEVILDFTGVSGVGQAFADEIFRVWARAHPMTKLTAVNMSPAVEFMVRRALV